MTTRLTESPADGHTPAQLAIDVDPPTMSTERTQRGWALPPAGAPAWIWVGVATVVVGFVVIAVGWGQVAAETQVYLQLPYVVSAGLVGLGLVMVGLAVLNVVTRQRDSHDRDHLIAELVAIIEEMKELLAEDDRR